MPRKKVLLLVKPLCEREGCLMEGKQHERCRAHTRLGNPCKQPCMDGQFVCRLHGGKTPEALERGVQRQALTMAQSLVAFNPEDGESLEEGLLREVKQASQTALAYGLAVSALTDEHGMQGIVQIGATGLSMHALVQAWDKERERHARFAKMAIDAGIAQRTVELAENQAGTLVRVLVAVLSSPALGLTAEQVIEGKVIAAGELRAASANP